jgi:hypothetical protein
VARGNGLGNGKETGIICAQSRAEPGGDFLPAKYKNSLEGATHPQPMN